MNITAHDLASRFDNTKEVAGHASNPQVLAMLQLDAGLAVTDDETAWCSAFVNYIAWLLRLPRSKSLAARSWLNVGVPIQLNDAKVGYDVVILSRGEGLQPGATVLNAPGHVGFYSGFVTGKIWLRGGNQGNAVSVEGFDPARILGIRRLYSE